MNKKFNLLNNVTGWLVFLVAMVTYTLTVEPTGSFWDCGEFISASYKLQIPHPPGAPLFLLVGRLFSLFAGDNVEQVAFWVNMVSVLSSAFTILFLFWTITLLALKILVKPGESPDTGNTILILGASAIGSLAFTFTDSFWFSAVEAEVYAMSSLFTALVFWAMLKWERVADEPGADKWLLVIAYLTGLSIGVHLLNLVSLPALGLIYYFKRYKKVTFWGGFAAFALSGLILVTILNGIIPGLASVAGKFEIFFVNSLSMPFGSGIIFFGVLLLAAIVFGIIVSKRNNKYYAFLAIKSLVFIILGYASYGIIVVRSQYDPPIDENDPENVISFVYYLKREQYGDRPLLYGPQFNAQVIDQKKGEPIYIKKGDKYEIVDYKIINKYDPKMMSVFPRVYSNRGDHVEAYKQLIKIRSNDRPISFGDNLKIFFNRQLGFFYYRYFMWNFSGRESDIQDATFLTPFDAFGDSSNPMPKLLAENPGRNNYFWLPLILGFAGLFFQFKRKKLDSYVVAMMFFMTGIAIIIYLNQPPTEPRERDYTHVGSFYTFSIWIGLGVIMLADFIRRFFKSGIIAPAVSILLSLSVPGILLAENWDDHNRARRFHSVDSAKNLLNSCDKNAILFTGGDNDTFPLWYAQEVEGFRTDVRVCNLSLLGTDWYINQMKNKAYDSEPLPITLSYENYINGTNDYIQFYEIKSVASGMDLYRYITLLEARDRNLVLPSRSGSKVSIMPTKMFVLKYDTAKVKASKSIPEKLHNRLIPEIRWDIARTHLFKSDLLMLDILATNAKNGWQRPIYFSTTLSNSNYLNLRRYFQLEGLAYRLLPVDFGNAGPMGEYVDTEIAYDKMMNKMYWRGLNDSTIYYDENYRRFPLNARICFSRLAVALIQENKKDKAKEVLDRCISVMPDNTIPYDAYSPTMAEAYYLLGEKEKADQMADIMINRADEFLRYYRKADPNNSDLTTHYFIVQQFNEIARNQNNKELATRCEAILIKYQDLVQRFRRG